MLITASTNHTLSKNVVFNKYIDILIEKCKENSLDINIAIKLNSVNNAKSFMF